MIPEQQSIPFSGLIGVHHSVQTISHISSLKLTIIQLGIKVFSSRCQDLKELKIRRHIRHFEILYEIVLYGHCNDLAALEHDLVSVKLTKDQPLLRAGTILPLITGKT